MVQAPFDRQAIGVAGHVSLCSNAVDAVVVGAPVEPVDGGLDEIANVAVADLEDRALAALSTVGVDAEGAGLVRGEAVLGEDVDRPAGTTSQYLCQ